MLKIPSHTKFIKMEVQMTNPQLVSSDEIDLSELFRAIWQGKWLIIATTGIFTIVAIFFTLSLPDIYKSEVTLAPAEDNNLKVPGQLGGLAALAGVNFGGQGGDKTEFALEILKSRAFLGQFIEQNDLYVPIMAAKGWERATNKLIIDPEIYNEEKQLWVREVDEPFKPKPSMLETIEQFEKIFSVHQTKENEFVILKLEHYSPYFARETIDKIVVAVNENIRQRDIVQTNKRIEYLKRKMEETTVSSVKSMFYTLIEEQLKKLMMANVENEYVLITIDKAFVSEKKHGPKRMLIVFSVAIFGFFISVIFSVIHFLFSRKIRSQ